MIGMRRLEEKLRNFAMRNWHYLLVLFFALLLTVGVWSGLRGFLLGDDANFHIARLQNAAHAWRDGQIIPQVDPTVLDGFGYGYNLFYGPLITYLAAILRVLTFSWQITSNLLWIFIIAAAGLTMCYAIQQISKNKVFAALTGMIYLTMPYLAVDLYMRSALGEVIGLAVAPILLLGIYQLLHQQTGAATKIIISASILLLSHNLSTILLALLAAGLLLLNFKVLKSRWVWRQIGFSVVVILGLTAFLTLPLIEAKLQGHYAIFDAEYSATQFAASAEAMNEQRLTFAQALLSNYSSTRVQDNLAIDLLAIGGMVGFLVMRKTILNADERKFVTDLYIIAIVALLGTTTLINWRFLPSPTYTLQFPWRLLSVFAVTGSVVMGYTFYSLISQTALNRQKLIVCLVGLVAIYPLIPVINYGSTRHLERGEVLATNVYNSTIGHQSEYAPIEMLCFTTSDGTKDCQVDNIYRFIAQRGTDIKILSGDAEIISSAPDGTHYSINIQTNTETVLELPQIWYPGYQAKLGNKTLQVGATADGLVGITIPANISGELHSYYGLSNFTKIGTVITAGTIVSLGIRARRRKKLSKVK